jgi:hypothetical protein
MKASELIAELQRLMQKKGDPEVIAQTDGCCSHGHYIEQVDDGLDSEWDDEHEEIVLRCG